MLLVLLILASHRTTRGGESLQHVLKRSVSARISPYNAYVSSATILSPAIYGQTSSLSTTVTLSIVHALVSLFHGGIVCTKHKTIQIDSETMLGASGGEH